MTAILKNRKSPYLSIGLTDSMKFGTVMHTDPQTLLEVKILNFKNSRLVK